MLTGTRRALSAPHPHMGALISSYQDGLATPSEADQVERHLLECDACRAFYGMLQEARAMIAGLPARDPALGEIASTYQAVLRRVGGRGGR